MSGEHTPGPWATVELPTAIAIKSHKGNVANIQRSANRTSEQKANACLIAAAPELLDALKHIDSAACYASEVATETREAMLLHIGQTARAAIAKVEGGEV